MARQPPKRRKDKMKRLEERLLDKLSGWPQMFEEGPGLHVRFVWHLLNYDHSIKKITRQLTTGTACARIGA